MWKCNKFDGETTADGLMLMIICDLRLLREENYKARPPFLCFLAIFQNVSPTSTSPLDRTIYVLCMFFLWPFIPRISKYTHQTAPRCCCCCCCVFFVFFWVGGLIQFMLEELKIQQFKKYKSCFEKGYLYYYRVGETSRAGQGSFCMAGELALSPSGANHHSGPFRRTAAVERQLIGPGVVFRPIPARLSRLIGASGQHLATQTPLMTEQRRAPLYVASRTAPRFVICIQVVCSDEEKRGKKTEAPRLPRLVFINM